MEKHSIEYALLSVQSALLEAVTPELRAVTTDVHLDDRTFCMHFYYHGEQPEDILELWSCAATEASCHMPLRYHTDEQYTRIDFPQKILIESGRYAYLRKENGFDANFHTDKMIIKKFSTAYALLDMQSALLGIVTPELRVVVVDADEEKLLLYIHFYYDGHVSEEVIQLWEKAIDAVIAPLGAQYTVDRGVERIDFPGKFPFRGRCAYLRKEPVLK